ncbi:organic hydroperoxide resistance protein [Myceligenerans salitolerans]|uniref:Organic hydroperoxide resistance protein n=1 Tax=Myceligenerans salitolerans TaxID=1230528 RepID=A0ABS3I7F7_9MICO|nr:organic hydroperoxide resistance protein [Myceligenerans salitolerans]MBO0608925.1 organic hydroperoxide resistance protein [Myceligenerans salitolerans]
MPALYTASATATGDGRDGRTVTSDGLLDLDLAVQKELGGAGGATNPEQLFAAGWAACFHGALKAVARQEKTPVRDTAVTADVGIGPNETGGFALEAVLTVEIGGVDQPTAERLVAAAHEVCPYSNATRGNVPTDLKVVTA